MEVIAGVDEAGRGPLAGPVCAAAVILPENHKITGLNDSKKLTARQREKLYDIIIDQAVAVGVGWVDVDEIDRINILQATYKAMQMAIGRLNTRFDKALIDGYGLPSQVIPNEGIIGGDRKVDCIKAASIIAKVSRDRLMGEMDIIFPGYGFAGHKGYGTPQHMEALEKLKATPIHRRSFKPVSDHLPRISWLREQHRIGWWGERLACLELQKQGAEIIATNVTCSNYGEIDIVADSGEEMIFVEVKTITKAQLGSPEEKVDQAKLVRLERAIDYYMMKNELEKDIRLDVITVSIGRGRPVLKQFRSVGLD